MAASAADAGKTIMAGLFIKKLSNAVVTIHGGVGREERRKAEEQPNHNKDVEILVATDAAGGSINLQSGTC